MKEPWFRKARNCWFVTDDSGQQIRLDPDKKVAWELWHQLNAKEQRLEDKNPTLRELVTEYTIDAKRQIRNGSLTVKTLSDYLWYIDQFLELHGETPILEIEPLHVTNWLNGKSTWGNSAQRGAITAIQRVFNWGQRERRIAGNNLEYMTKPPQNRREKLVAPDEHREMILAIRNGGSASVADKQFQLALIAIRHTGGRPQDVASVRVEHVDQAITTWTLPDHKRRKHTKKPKTVHLSPCLQTITRMLIEDRDSGPLFRGRGGRLSVNAITCRVKRLKEKLQIDPSLVPYSYRHTYITDCLERGVDIATVAELVGTSVQMIERHYGHLSKRHDHLRASAAKALQPIKQN